MSDLMCERESAFFLGHVFHPLSDIRCIIYEPVMYRVTMVVCNKVSLT